ncbi:Uncharacterised protein [Chryseobacterium nakagawai]|uniref:Lipoprotein n=1 Tax=Chryseobacterium nakagawai TaxID=1241982 RepID=A0AAD0YN82_CHRNA|nr:hypothetical protein [Chryseobacterium nakagawai]AZA92340.1 hypothetical protein EG343_17830 [Chryseobacterium nakagawai]VEH18899.1 Uncharacterised protein [Chryseobacterium nakagawai]
MKNIIHYHILFLVILFSCKKANSLNTANEKASIVNTTNSTKENLYTEILNSSKQTDYDLNKKVQKLDLNHNSLTVKIRYISERAYISIENNKKEFVSWKPVHINFFYDTSFDLAEKDIHILLKENDTSEGYLLLPSFTEQFSTYSLYQFRKDALNFIGTYEVSEFVKGTFSFDENSKNVYIEASTSKKLKLNKIEQNQDEKFNNIEEDIKLLNGKAEEKNAISINKYLNNNQYLVKTFDINKDGILDKIISSKPYEGEDLLIFLGDSGSNYKFVLKTTNFSQDGGNQISDIKQTKDGFVLITAFPDRGESRSNYYISSSNESFILKKIEQESYSWQDGYTETCIQNFNFDLKNTLESLSNTIAKTKSNCTKKFDKKN